ncbi:DUF4114 domain-containing protein, partial [Geitlerinema sp. P-1104]|uniref:DUF4114 domain-containing protein n=1 Tax=Geitlerinema sp. P-1104 TaxID=2546230 RepID=UPI0014772CBE
MSPFNPKSWFNRRFRQNPPEATAKEDQQQTFILEPIYTPSGFLDSGDDSDGLDLGPVDEPMDDFSDALSPDGESDVPGDDGDNIGDEGDLDIEEEDILPKGEEGVNYLDDEYISDNEIGETIPYAGDDEVETTEPSDSMEEVENALEDDSDIPDDDGEINNEEELTDEESPESQEDSEEDDGNDDDVKNEVEDNPDDEGNDDDVKNEVEDNPDDDTENLGDDDNSGETDEEAADVENDEEGESETDDDDEDELEEDEEDNPLAFDVPEFNSGIFQVGASGEVGVDFLFDGGAYQGEVAFFSLAGFDELEFNGIEDFIAEAAQRAASGSEQGHIVIRVADEGARFTGSLFGEPDWNTGVYQGVKTFNMTPGDEFGVMLVPNGRVSEVLDNPSIGGAKRPLFSLASTNPKEGFHLGQIADLTGDGNTFVFEDKRVEVSDWDYDDVIFQIRGAVGDAVHVENVIAPDLDWRQDDLGKALLAYSKPYLATSEQLDLAELVTQDPDGLLDGDDGFSSPDADNSDLPGEELDDAELDEVEEADTLGESDEESQESQSESESVDEDEAGESSSDSTSDSDRSSTSGGSETVSETPSSSQESEVTSGEDSGETVTGGDVSQGSESAEEGSEAQLEGGSEEPVSDESVADNPVSENEVDESSNGSSNESSEETADSQGADPLVTAAQGFEFAKEDQPLVGIIDTGFAENNPDLNYDNFILGRDWVDGDDNPLLAPGEGSEHGTH